MPLKIIRNDIVSMNVDAVVNTASSYVSVGTGCDTAIYNAAGYDQLIKEREKIGEVPEGESFITPGFNLPAKYIIHTVSPLYIDGESGEEDKLRNCYRNSLDLAVKNNISSIAFPLISTGSFGYPREEGMRIAIDEITSFLSNHEMMIFIVVFDSVSTGIAGRIAGDLESYIDDKYVEGSFATRSIRSMPRSAEPFNDPPINAQPAMYPSESRIQKKNSLRDIFRRTRSVQEDKPRDIQNVQTKDMKAMPYEVMADYSEPYMANSLEDSLDDRISHMSDSFSRYLLYLIERKGMKNSDVYKRAVVDKKVFSKIKNNPNYHPNKMTAMCLCVGAMLNIDDTKDLLARAGYALSPCDKTDVIFSYFIEHEIFDIIEIDLALEDHGMPCLIE